VTSSSGAHDGVVPHGPPHGEEVSHGSRRGYLIGFALSVVLTAIPFWLVMAHVIAGSAAAAITVMLVGGVQVVVHMIYFLHMNTRSEGGWNFLALMFTVTLVVIALAGSLWVMFHMNANMTPTMGGQTGAPAAANDMGAM
jgi:cytochrome o ubiquinol oxidase subunit IV